MWCCLRTEWEEDWQNRAIVQNKLVSTGGPRGGIMAHFILLHHTSVAPLHATPTWTAWCGSQHRLLARAAQGQRLSSSLKISFHSGDLQVDSTRLNSSLATDKCLFGKPLLPLSKARRNVFRGSHKSQRPLGVNSPRSPFHRQDWVHLVAAWRMLA